jgi:hypothetical protein
MKLRLGKTGERDQVRRIGDYSGLLKQFGDGGACETCPAAGAGLEAPDAADPALKSAVPWSPRTRTCAPAAAVDGNQLLAQLPYIRSDVSH